VNFALPEFSVIRGTERGEVVERARALRAPSVGYRLTAPSRRATESIAPAASP
jgi:hypothetical protein